VILAAGLLVLLGLGFFLAGVLTGTTVFYWVCVAVCVLAAVLLFAARRRISQAEATPAGTAPVAGASPTTASAPDERPAAADPTPAEVPAAEAVASDAEPAPRPPAHAHPGPGAGSSAPSPADLKDPPIEDVEVTDLLLVVDLKDEVLVVDEHPRYHLPGCRFLVGRTAIPLPMDEARVDGFSPCALCTPDRHLADRERARKHSGGA
jgi:hypothetical protein